MSISTLGKNLVKLEYRLDRPDAETICQRRRPEAGGAATGT